MAERKTVTAKMILQLIESQEYLCALSGRRLTPETASIDHIVPMSRGGKHDIGNLWVVDHHVNSAKGTMTVEEFVNLCRDVASHFANREVAIASVGTSDPS